jgi:hypothetical protein
MPRWARPAPRADGFKSSLEARVAKQIQEQTGKPADYEQETIEYTVPECAHKYRPDFRLPNGIIVESKGIFDAEDRKKHLLIKTQHPLLDIRFVFTRSAAPIYPKAKTTMAEWCQKHGFLYGDKLIPPSWFKEKLRAS